MAQIPMRHPEKGLWLAESEVEAMELAIRGYQREGHPAPEAAQPPAAPPAAGPAKPAAAAPSGGDS